MLRTLRRELAGHLPFTSFGAVTGIVLMCGIAWGDVPASVSGTLFYVFHPVHVLLSALVTCSMYWRYRKNVVSAIVIGYVGSIGIATVSDIVFPYLGGVMLGAEVHFHLGFIEKWWLVNPLALAGIGIGLWRPTTRIPHFGHVLLSTWASLFYLTAYVQADWMRTWVLLFVFIILVAAVWLPCCVSDIVFPLLFVGKGAGTVHEELHHSH